MSSRVGSVGLSDKVTGRLSPEGEYELVEEVLRQRTQETQRAHRALNMLLNVNFLLTVIGSHHRV